MKRKTALILSIALMLSGCAGNASKTAQTAEQTAAPAAELVKADHTLQEIVILGKEKPTTVNMPSPEKISGLDENLFFKLSGSMSSIVLRGWNATDLSLYKNGCITLDVKGTGTAFDIGFGELINGQSINTTVTKAVTLSDEWTTVEIPLSEISSELLHVREFQIGNADGEIYVSNIKLISIDSERIYPLIKADQAGYKPNAEKTALVTGFGDVIGCNAGTEFELVNAENNETVYTGTLTLVSAYDELYSGEAILQADFTEYTQQGKYYLKISDEVSPSFEISEDVYDGLLADTMRYFYYQRANCDITEEYGGASTRADITPEDYSIDGTDVSGGWYDAGDIGKYVSPGATAINTLLWAYKLYPDKFYDGQNNIPESTNGIPDILDEVRYELDFLLKMQDKESGGFFMKIKSRSENDNAADRAVWEHSTNSTADCAAVLAFASTIYREFDSEYADKMLAAAETGWRYTEKYPDKYINTTYSGEKDAGSTFWAAGCLYYATGKEVYGRYIKEHCTDNLKVFKGGENCHNVGKMAAYGYYTYLLSDNTDEETRAMIIKNYKSWRSGIRRRYENNPWNVCINEWSFWWGSFNTILGGAQDMIIGNYAMGDAIDEPMKISEDAVHFIMGENPLRKSFVTGHGEDCIAQTFSSFWEAGEGFPHGYMPGGINASEGRILSRYPMKCYTDEPFDWVTNENAVYWNAVMVFNAAAQA